MGRQHGRQCIKISIDMRCDNGQILFVGKVLCRHAEFLLGMARIVFPDNLFYFLIIGTYRRFYQGIVFENQDPALQKGFTPSTLNRNRYVSNRGLNLNPAPGDMNGGEKN